MNAAGKERVPDMIIVYPDRDGNECLVDESDRPVMIDAAVHGVTLVMTVTSEETKNLILKLRED